MKNSLLIAAMTGSVVMIMGHAPAQAAMVNLAGAAVPTSATGDSLVHKTQRRGGGNWRRGSNRRWSGGRRRGPGRGVAIGAGVALGVLGAIAASEAHARYSNRCARWRRWCRNGDDSACWKYDERC